ncbi:MAG: hypothetical protein DRJ03_20155 [Chloroflexi bacterium]|nr:MAG: hypothetical protein DRI81_10605 [Chloroflexota bacterium]RLC81461.1 MAG: hypothetical protein DRJ03_20155 [Chloroflexota bacterium]
MKRHYPPGTTPLSSPEEYLEHWRRRDELNEQDRRLTERYRSLKKENPKLAEKVMEELQALTRRQNAMLTEYADRLPIWLHSRCPFCGEPLYWKIDPFDLDGDWWHWRGIQGEWIIPPTCPHLFCVDGALNLEEHQPTEVQRRVVWMASEVPFVKPRLLELGNVIAVIHRLPQKIAGRYTGYPVVYFGNPRPPLSEGSLGWARTEYYDENGMWLIIYDVQDYDLDKWIAARKVCWLAPDDPEHPLVCGLPEDYPFRDVPGRQRPYTIEKGQVWHGYPADGRTGGP